MPPAISSSAQSRPWWSRSKSSKDSLRPNRSVSSLAEEDEKYPSTASSASPRSKDALPSLKFNTLASAIGLKSKRLPALTIQDPPSPLPSSPRAYPRSRPGSGNSSTAHSPVPVERTPFYTNRPPAKSVSTVRSSEYDYDAASEPHSEPRTPSDHPRDRSSYQHSVMTFSELDPFASAGIVVQHLPQDPNRLSVYSDSSVLDPQHKRPDMPTHNRGSYGSSSSNSHGNYSDVQALSPLSVASSFGRSPPASRSAYDLSQTHDSYYMDSPPASGVQAQRTRRMKTPSGSNSSNSTVTPHDYRARLSEPPGGGATPHLFRKRSSPSLVRPRGMTVGAIDHRPSTAATTLSPTPPLQIRRKASGSSSPSSSNTPSPSPVTFTRNRSTSSATSTNADSPVSPGSSKRPLVVVRKASSSRLPPLPAAPPTSDLPPPPIPTSPYDMSPIEFRASSSSSSLNFAPSVDLHDLDDAGDAISQLMNNSYDLGPFEARDSVSAKGKRRSRRNMYVLDGDLSPVSPADIEASLPSPLSKFPPVPVSVFGEIHPKAGKLLKKMSSQQNLAQRHSAASVSSTGPVEETNGHGSNGHASQHSGKTPRKQRSFHASRVPLPPLPGLRHGSSSNGHHASTSSEALTQTQPSSPVVEPRRSSVTSPRKRLFSGSSARRSTSSHGPLSPAEDDKRSVFSFDSDIRPATSTGIEPITMSFGAAGGPLSLMTRNACISPSSMWEDSGSKRASQSEYIPQYIMSPAEQLKLAEKLADEDYSSASVQEREPEREQERKPKLDLQPGDFGLTYSASGPSARSRSNSVLSSTSTGTLAFGPGSDRPGVSRGPSILSSKSLASASRPQAPPMRKVALVDPTRGGPSRSSSMLAKALNRPPPLSVRPATAQASLTPPTSPGLPATHSPEIPSASLPPPPRRRPSRHDLQEIEAAAMKRISVVPINPLSPPPSVRSARARRQESTDTTTTVSRPPSSFDRQKAMQRRSLMKKPSFLDIEDEMDGSAENGSDEEYGTSTVPEVPDSPTVDFESSFLDMDRGKNSFDTVRSTDSAFFV